MKVLVIHNHYQRYGGEDTTVAQETALLRSAKHEVVEYQRSNWEVDSFRFWQKLSLPMRFIWATDSYRELRTIIDREKPDIAHFHNTHFMISPSAYYAVHDANVPAVQSLHNYRFLCPSAT